MDSLSVFDPKNLPRKERFHSGRRSCKGCTKSLAARLVSTVADSADPSLGGINGQNDGLSANTFAHDLVNTADTLEKFVSVVKSFNKKSASQSLTAHSAIKKPVIGIDRKVLDSDYLVLERFLKNSNGLVICFDNELAIDKLIRKAIPRPFIENGRIQPVTKKDVREAVRQKNIPDVMEKGDFSYMATACPSHQSDLIEKVRRGIDSSGNAFILVLTPCPTGWMFASDKSLDMGRHAVSTGYFPLFEVNDGKIRLTVQRKDQKPVHEYVALQKRFLTFPSGLVVALQSAVDEFYEDIQNTGTIHEIATKKLS